MFPLRSALLIDYDNVAPFFPNFAFSGRVANWSSWLEDGQFDPEKRKRRFAVKKVYWHQVFANEQPAFEQHGFDTRTCLYAAGGKMGQSAVDLYLAIDAIEIALKPQGVKEIIILASDSDYVPVVERIKEKGLLTTIIVSDRDASSVYQGKADTIIRDEDLRQALSYVRKKGARVLEQDPIYAAPIVGGAGTRGMGAHAKMIAKPTPKASTRPVAEAEFEEVATVMVELASAQPGYPVGKDRVVRRFLKLAGFTKEGPRRWFGCGSYERLLEEVVRRRAELEIRHYPEGGVAVLLKKEGGPGAAT